MAGQRQEQPQEHLRQQEERDRAQLDAKQVIWERKRYYCCFGWQQPMFHAGWVDGELHPVPKSEHPSTREYRAAKSSPESDKEWRYKILVNEHTDAQGWQYGRWTWQQLRKLRDKGRNRQTHPDLVRRRQWVHRDCAEHILSAPSTAEAHAKRGAVFVLDPVEMAQREQEAAARNNEASRAIKELLRELQQRTRFKSLALSLLDPLAVYAVTQRHIKAMSALQARALRELQPAYVAPTEEAARDLGGRPDVPPTWQHRDADHNTDTATSPAVPEHMQQDGHKHMRNPRQFAGSSETAQSTRTWGKRRQHQHSGVSQAGGLTAAPGAAPVPVSGAHGSGAAGSRDVTHMFGEPHDLRSRIGSSFLHPFRGMHNSRTLSGASIMRGFSQWRLPRFPWQQFLHRGMRTEPGRIVLSLTELECATGHSMGVYGEIEQYLDAYPHKTYYDAVMKVTGVPESDVLKAVWRSTPFRPAHYVAVDHARHKIVVCVRGTFDASDRLTDLVCRPVMHDFGVPGMQGLVHTGILRSALNIVETVRDVVCEAVSRHPEYDILLTGHSLGGGTAALLAMMLRYDDALPERQRQRLRCIALAPVAAFGAKLDNTCQDYVASIVYNWDMIPRVDIVSMAKYLTQLSHHSPFRRAMLSVYRAIKSLAGGGSGHKKQLSTSNESQRAQPDKPGSESTGKQNKGAVATEPQEDVDTLAGVSRTPVTAQLQTLAAVPSAAMPAPARVAAADTGPPAVAAVPAAAATAQHPVGTAVVSLPAAVPTHTSIPTPATRLHGHSTTTPGASTLPAVRQAAAPCCEDVVPMPGLQQACDGRACQQEHDMVCQQSPASEPSGPDTPSECVHEHAKQTSMQSSSLPLSTTQPAPLVAEIEEAPLSGLEQEDRTWQEQEAALQHAIHALHDLMAPARTSNPPGGRAAPAGAKPESDADATAIMSVMEHTGLQISKHEQQAAQQAMPLLTSALHHLQQLRALNTNAQEQANTAHQGQAGAVNVHSTALQQQQQQQGQQPLDEQQAWLQERISTDLLTALAIMQDTGTSTANDSSGSTTKHGTSGAELSDAATCAQAPQHDCRHTFLASTAYQHSSGSQSGINSGSHADMAGQTSRPPDAPPQNAPYQDFQHLHVQNQNTSHGADQRHSIAPANHSQPPDALHPDAISGVDQYQVPREAVGDEDRGEPADVPAGKSKPEECGDGCEEMTPENKDGLLEPLQLPGAVFWLVRDTRVRHKRVRLGAGRVFGGMKRFFSSEGKDAASVEGSSDQEPVGTQRTSFLNGWTLGLEGTEEEADTGDMDDVDPRHMGKYSDGDAAKPKRRKQLPLVLLSADDSWFKDLFITWKALHDHMPQKYDQAMNQLIMQEKLKMKKQ